jgi:hypothetical protein
MDIRYVVFFFALLVLVGIFSPTPTKAQSCSGFNTQLQAGITAEVLPGAPNTLRQAPSTSSARLGSIPAGGRMTVIGGPRCANGYTFWQVNYDGDIGWTAEGDNSEYYIAPVEPTGGAAGGGSTSSGNGQPPESQSVQTRPNNVLQGIGTQLGGGDGDGIPITQLLRDANAALGGAYFGDYIGNNGRIDIREPYPNALSFRSEPFFVVRECVAQNTTRCVSGNYTVIATAPNGEAYQLTAHDTVRQINCQGALPSQLSDNGRARVIDNGSGANNIRTEPEVTGRVIGQIPPRGIADIIGSARCGTQNPNVWWYVDYQGIQGWTAENSATQQWLEYVPEYQEYHLPLAAYVQSGTWTISSGNFRIQIVVPSANFPYGVRFEDEYAVTGFAPYESLIAIDISQDIAATLVADQNGRANFTGNNEASFALIVGETGTYVTVTREGFSSNNGLSSITLEEVLQLVMRNHFGR